MRPSVQTERRDDVTSAEAACFRQKDVHLQNSPPGGAVAQIVVIRVRDLAASAGGPRQCGRRHGRVGIGAGRGNDARARLARHRLVALKSPSPEVAHGECGYRAQKA